MPDLRLLSVYDVSRRLNCSTGHVRKLIRVGRLKAFNIGVGDQRTEWRISEEALGVFIQCAAQLAADRVR